MRQGCRTVSLGMTLGTPQRTSVSTPVLSMRPRRVQPEEGDESWTAPSTGADTGVGVGVLGARDGSKKVPQRSPSTAGALSSSSQSSPASVMRSSSPVHRRVQPDADLEEAVEADETIEVPDGGQRADDEVTPFAPS